MAKVKSGKAKTDKSKSSAQESAVEAAAMDAMSQCAMLCQEQRWREALLLCRHVFEKASKDGNADLFVSLAGAQRKIEYSLRRQMATAVVEAARQVLVKEYLLNVGE